jgi:hypothetical protein
VDIFKMIRKYLLKPDNKEDGSTPARKSRRRSERDIYFTQNFHAKARQWGLSEDHARFVFYEGDAVKANMKVARYKGEEIGIYVFRDRDTNQPVVTSIWKRRFRGKSQPPPNR